MAAQDEERGEQCERRDTKQRNSIETDCLVAQRLGHAVVDQLGHEWPNESHRSKAKRDCKEDEGEPA